MTRTVEGLEQRLAWMRDSVAGGLAKAGCLAEMAGDAKHQALHFRPAPAGGRRQSRRARRRQGRKAAASIVHKNHDKRQTLEGARISVRPLALHARCVTEHLHIRHRSFAGMKPDRHRSALPPPRASGSDA